MIKIDTIEIRQRKINQRILIKDRIEILNRVHNIDTKFVWSNGRRAGVYFPKRNIILMGPKAWNGVESTFLHLYAHAILHQNCLNSRPHSLRYMECLWKLVIAHYDNPMRYQWWGEQLENHAIWTE